MKFIMALLSACIVLGGCNESKSFTREQLAGTWRCIEETIDEPESIMSFSQTGRFTWEIPTKVRSMHVYGKADYELIGSTITMSALQFSASDVPNSEQTGLGKPERSFKATITKLSNHNLMMVGTSSLIVREMDPISTVYSCRRSEPVATPDSPSVVFR